MRKFPISTLVLMTTLLVVNLPVQAASYEKGVAGIKNDPLNVEVKYLYRSTRKSSFKLLTNGSVLHSGDYFKIVFIPEENCQVYIFQVDSANKLFRLFPTQDFDGIKVKNANPVKAGKTYYIPGKHQSFELDQQTGLETIYFIAARQGEATLDLERQYQALLLAEQQNRIAQVQRIQVQLIITMRRSIKGVSQIVTDVEGVQANTSLQQNLQEMCYGCVDILTFQHQ